MCLHLNFYHFASVHAEIILAELMSKPTKTVASALQKLVRAVLKLRLGEPNDAKIMLTSMSKVNRGLDVIYVAWNSPNGVYYEQSSEIRTAYMCHLVEKLTKINIFNTVFFWPPNIRTSQYL